jgi:DNA-binding SARP family transcriptional activator
MRPPLTEPSAVPTSTVVNLFGGPFVTVGGARHEVPEGSKRLLAFVALRHGRVQRPRVAGVLWPDGTDGRATGNLRSALWRLRGAGIDVLTADKCSIALRDGVLVDAHVLTEWANRVIAGRPRGGDLALSWLSTEHLDLLPGCSDDWAIADRERLRHWMLHAIEALSRALARLGRYADAVTAAMVATDADPLRESAHRVLVEAHLAGGNRAEAERAVLAFRANLRRRLGVEPEASFTSLLREPPRLALAGSHVSPRRHP